MALRRWLQRLGILRDPAPRVFELDAALHPLLVSLAEAQQRSPDELASSLVASALAQQAGQSELGRTWQALPPRQQQVTALICLGYTNRQIAARLGIAINTVHTHSRHSQAAFSVNSKAGLRQLLAGWDFSGWDA